MRRACLSTITLWIAVWAYNVDDRYPVFWSAPESADSYFGFTVAFHNSLDTYLVGAPRANISGSQRFGALYQCTSRGCRRVNLYTSGIDTRAVLQDSMVGTSLQVDPVSGHVVVCGHLLKFRMTLDGKDSYYPYGVCFVQSGRATYRRIIPLQPAGTANLYEGSLAGYSATFTEDMLVLAALGADRTDMQALLVYYSKRDFSRQTPERSRSIPLSPQDYSYLGYSLTSGKFSRATRRDFIAAGAPRANDLKGQIVFYSADGERRLSTVLRGSQFGGYYGASVLGVDLNKDGVTDLLVGAPLYSTSARGEEGRVFVYLDPLTTTSSVAYLEGMKKSKARFGTALAAIGDLNKDTFQDVAVGAPYEDDRGAVYIYHGQSTGISSAFTQRIAAEDLPTPSLIRGFGISVVGRKDVDRNQYPDLLVGAYVSGHAVLLRSRPIVEVRGNVTFTVSKVDIFDNQCQMNGSRTTCFQMLVCASYINRTILPQANLTIALEVDPGNRHPRVYIQDGSGGYGWTLGKSFVASANLEKCARAMCYLQQSTKTDFQRPIQFQLMVNLSDACELCPTLDRSKPTSFSFQLPFQTTCGGRQECRSELTVLASIVTPRDDREIIVGLDHAVMIRIEVRNEGDPAHRAQVNITVPMDVGFTGNPYCEDATDSAVQERNTTLLCDVGNPLQTSEVLNVQLDIARVPAYMPAFLVELSTLTTSNETNPHEDPTPLLVQLTYSVDIVITGRAADDVKYLKDQTTTLTAEHTFVVQNAGYTPVKNVSVSLSVPQRLRRGLGSIRPFKPKVNSEVVQCNYTAEDRPVRPSEKNEKPEARRVSRSVHEDCPMAPCTRIHCFVGPLQRDKHILLTLELEVNVSASRMDDDQMSELVTSATVDIPDEWIARRARVQQKTATAKTTFLKTPVTKARVPTWVIATSAIAGLLVLLIIVVIMIKVGFFRRKRREAMLRLMMEAEPGTEVDPDWTPYVPADGSQDFND